MLGAFYYMEDAEEYAAINVFGAGLFIDAVATNKTEGYALFAHGSYALSDALTFTAGIRYSDEEKDFTLVETLDFGGFQVGPFPFSASDSWSSTTPKFVLDYKVTDDLMLYASAAAGFKSGGYNVSLAQSSFDPEKSWNYEAGFKSQWAGNRLRLNGAMFYTDYEDMQVRVPLGPGFIEVQNAAEATMKGAELEFTAQATPALEISGFVSYLDAEYSEYLQDVFDPLTGDVVDTIDLSGNKTNRAPEWQFRISAGYTWSLESGAEVVLRGSYKWQDDEFYSPENEPTLGHSGYELVSGRVTYTHSDGKWQLYAFGDNLTDERFRSTAFAINGQAIAAISDPLVWGVGFKWMGE
jgi:iron complex outermembrane receptor protein